MQLNDITKEAWRDKHTAFKEDLSQELGLRFSSSSNTEDIRRSVAETVRTTLSKHFPDPLVLSEITQNVAIVFPEDGSEDTRVFVKFGALPRAIRAVGAEREHFINVTVEKLKARYLVETSVEKKVSIAMGEFSILFDAVFVSEELTNEIVVLFQAGALSTSLSSYKTQINDAWTAQAVSRLTMLLQDVDHFFQMLDDEDA